MSNHSHQKVILHKDTRTLFLCLSIFCLSSFLLSFCCHCAFFSLFLSVFLLFYDISFALYTISCLFLVLDLNLPTFCLSLVGSLAWYQFYFSSDFILLSQYFRWKVHPSIHRKISHLPFSHFRLACRYVAGQVKNWSNVCLIWLALLITQQQQLQQPLLKHKQKHFVIFLHDAFKVQKPQLLLEAFLVGMLWEKSLKWPRTG